MMPRGKILLIISLLAMTILYANIDDDIQKIQNAPPSERYKLMNEFKKKLIKMNEKKRIDAIKKLGKKSNSKNIKQALEEIKRAQERKRLRKETEQQQIETDNIENETEDFNGGDNDND